MTTCTKLEKALENLEKNPFFNKYAKKIAKFQQTNPEEFLQRVEKEEEKIQRRRGTITYLVFVYLVFLLLIYCLLNYILVFLLFKCNK